MKRIFNKWEHLSIRYKLFTITSSLLIGLAIGIYLILYLLLPKYYHEYKIKSLRNTVVNLMDEAKNNDTEYLKDLLKDLVREQNLVLVLRDPIGKIIYGKTESLFITYNKVKLNKYSGEYTSEVFISTNDSEHPYKLNIIMPLQPIDEASKVISNIMPIIIILSLLVAIFGAYIYSKVITKPLIDIIENERQQESRRKDFVATISHELKTPITIISGQLEGMIYNIGKYKDRDTYLQKSYESTQELKDLVNEMIEISKADMIESDLKIKKIALSDLLYKLIDRQTFFIEEKRLKKEIYIEDDIYINADEEKITKAINNIINNAIKYSPDEERLIVRLFEEKHAKLHRKMNQNKIHLEIENTGVLIEKKYLEKIFTPFFRIEKSRSRKTGGSGLGLYIVSVILKSHGYEYYIKNKENSVIFTIIL